MEPYDRLISILDTFIEEFDGGMRIRGIKTALLIQRASIDGRGISLTEIARETRAPLENVRRHIAKHVALGQLRYLKDPDDERVTRVVYVDPDEQDAIARRIENRIAAIHRGDEPTDDR
jgi:DNA-binding MarR family transcriptional regulator